jgi:Ca2+-binding RTX toxin-like protein
VIEGSAHSVAAPPQASRCGQTYEFDSWSDGGAVAHNITAATDLRLEARYVSPLGSLPPALGECGARAVCGGTDVTIVGTERADTLIGTAGDDVIAGLGGKDKLVGKAGDDLICGGDGADILRGGAGKNLLKGGPGRDLCLVRARSDRVRGCERVRAH